MIATPLLPLPMPCRNVLVDGVLTSGNGGALSGDRDLVQVSPLRPRHDGAAIMAEPISAVILVAVMGFRPENATQLV
jgi:hypothetical protein